MKNLDIQCFVINLQCDIDKRNRMDSLLRARGIIPEFIAAIDGRSTGTFDEEVNYDKQKSIETIGRELAGTEIGCALSHIEVFKKVVTNGIQHCLVVEDDIDLADAFSKIIVPILNSKIDADIILLGSHASLDRHLDVNIKDRLVIDEDLALGRPLEKAFGTYGYILSNKGAHKLLKKTKKLHMPIDHYTGDPEVVDLLVASPSIIKVNKKIERNSSIERERKKLSKLRVSGSYSLKKNAIICLGLYPTYTKVRQLFRQLKKRKP